MAYVVLDTDVSSGLIKGRPLGSLGGQLLGATWCVTFVAVGELWQWAWARSWGAGSREHLEHWLSRVIVIDSDDGVCRVWGEICGAARRRGRLRPANDSWIAACCRSRALPLATFNVKDYADFVEHVGLPLSVC